MKKIKIFILMFILLIPFNLAFNVYYDSETGQIHDILYLNYDKDYSIANFFENYYVTEIINQNITSYYNGSENLGDCNISFFEGDLYIC